MKKTKFFNVKWIFKDKNLHQSHPLKLLNIHGKFQCTSVIDFSFDDALFIY
jgi:hypothetical protein